MVCHIYLFPELEHDIWNLNILLSLIFHRHLKYHILLMIRYRLLADRFDQIAQSVKL